MVMRKGVLRLLPAVAAAIRHFEARLPPPILYTVTWQPYDTDLRVPFMIRGPGGSLSDSLSVSLSLSLRGSARG